MPPLQRPCRRIFLTAALANCPLVLRSCPRPLPSSTAHQLSARILCQSCSWLSLEVAGVVCNEWGCMPQVNAAPHPSTWDAPFLRGRAICRRSQTQESPRTSPCASASHPDPGQLRHRIWAASSCPAPHHHTRASSLQRSRRIVIINIIYKGGQPSGVPHGNPEPPSWHPCSLPAMGSEASQRCSICIRTA